MDGWAILTVVEVLQRVYVDIGTRFGIGSRVWCHQRNVYMSRAMADVD